MITTTTDHQRERNRAKMAAYRARNPDKTRTQSRDAVRRMRERMKRDGVSRAPSVVVKAVKAITKKLAKSIPAPVEKVSPLANLSARFMAFRRKDRA